MERINGVEAVFRECVAGMKDDVKQLRAEIEKIRTNEIAHIASEIDDIRGDIETLKRFMWRTLGAFAVIVFLITIGSRLIKF
jgi:hypothetical protein